MVSFEQDLKSKHILIIDDEAIIAMAIEDALYDLGYMNVVVAFNVNDAITLFDNSAIDLAIMDINLNDSTDGIELAKLLKKKREVQVIFLTGNSDQVTISKAKYVEPMGFIVKPFDKKNLGINMEMALFQQMSISKSSQKNNQLLLDHFFYYNNPNLIIRIDVNKTILKINPVISRITGKQPDFYENKTIYNAEFEDAFVDQLKEIVDNVISRKRKTFIEINIGTLMGNRMMSIVAIPEIINENTVFSVAMILQDITDQKISADDLVKRNNRMLDSINYSEKIQKALLPDEFKLKKYLPDSFILFFPKDIVSGDFPWIYSKGNYLYIAVVDCTGHGVPGALMSIISHFLLNQIVRGGNELLPSKILDFLHAYIRKTLKQHMTGIESKDGADISLCRVNLDNGQLDYSGAHRPLILLKNNEIHEIKGDKRPIGGIHHTKNIKKPRFTNHSFQLEKNDFICMFSDGFTDQFGGDPLNQKKIGTEKLKEVLLNNANKPCSEISKTVSGFYYNWKGDVKQIDDVLMIGFSWNK